MAIENSASTWYAIVNPVSGNGKSGKHWHEVEQQLHQAGIVFEAQFTTKPRHAQEIVVDALKKGFRKILCVGGDGNLHDVANGLLSQNVVPATDVLVGIISLGTGNDFVKHYNIPTDIAAAVQVIKNEHTTLHDAGIATSFENGVQQHRFFINFCGVGFDAFVVERAAPWKPYGQIAYLLGTMRWLFAYKKPTLKITTNNYTVETVSYLSLAGIGKYSGGGMMLTPCAEANDGLFSFTLAKNLSKTEVIFRIKMMYDGSICKHREVDCSMTTTVSINVVNEYYPVKMQADGDVLGTGPFTMTILPQALCVVVP